MTNWTSLQKELFCALVGLARAQDGNEWRRNKQTDQIVCQSLCLLADYPIASDSLLQNALTQVRAEKDRLSPGCSTCASPCGRTEDLDVVSLQNFSSQKKALCHELVSNATQKTSCDSWVYDALFALGMPDGSGQVYSINYENA